MENKTVTPNKSTSPQKKWMDFKVGSVPLPVYIVMAAIIVLAGVMQQLPVNMLGGFAVILTLGWLLGTIGANIPIVKKVCLFHEHVCSF